MHYLIVGGQVRERVSRRLLANVSSLLPRFTVTGLDPGREVSLVIAAENSNGRSERVTLEVFTTKVAQLQIGEFSYWFGDYSSLVVLSTR